VISTVCQDASKPHKYKITSYDLRTRSIQVHLPISQNINCCRFRQRLGSSRRRQSGIIIIARFRILLPEELHGFASISAICRQVSESCSSINGSWKMVREQIFRNVCRLTRVPRYIAHSVYFQSTLLSRAPAWMTPSKHVKKREAGLRRSSALEQGTTSLIATSRMTGCILIMIRSTLSRRGRRPRWID
jgi:hypothetical protein